jgi:hypothetical protein
MNNANGMPRVHVRKQAEDELVCYNIFIMDPSPE